MVNPLVPRIKVPRTSRSLLATGLAILVVLGMGIPLGAARPAAASSLTYGAIAIRDSWDRLVPGVTVLIRAGACGTGAPVWNSVTSNRSDAYGAFAFTLPVGTYCSEVIAVPAGFQVTAPQVFTVGSAGPAWKTTWIPGAPLQPYRAVVATRNAYSQPIPGVRVVVAEGVCGANGRAVWDTVTPARSDAYGAFAFQLPGGQYCIQTLEVPAPYLRAQSVNVTLGGTTATTSVNLWLPMAPAPSMPAFAQQLFELTNATRARAGKLPLQYSAQVSSVAQAWSNQMASSGDFMHNPGYYSQMPAGWTRAGENVAYMQPVDFAAIQRQFEASPGHYQNIVGAFTTVGFGYATSSGGRGYVTVNFGTYSTNPS